MIPLCDVVPSRTRPVATLALIAVHVAVYLVRISQPDPGLRAGSWGADAAGVSIPAVLAATLVHGHWLHLAGNMLCLWVYGPTVEDRVGHGRFVGFYVACGLTAALAAFALEPAGASPAVGSSGAVAAVLGAYFLLFPRSRLLLLVPLGSAARIVEVAAITLPVYWVGLHLVLWLRTGGALRSFWTLAAGVMAGAIGILIVRRPERLRVEWWDAVRR